MTEPRAERQPAPGLRVAWLGHSGGRRADGLSTYSADVVGGLGERGCELWFHYAAADGAETPVDPARAVSWPAWRFKTVTVPRPGFRRRFGEWLSGHPPQVLHTSLSFSLDDGWVGREARARGAATVATFHLPFGAPGGPRAVVMRELHRFWAGRLAAYQRVIVFSPEHRQRLAGVGVARGRIEVVPNAVDSDRFHPGASELRQRLSGAGLVVGFMGRLDPEKGIRELLQGFGAADLGPDARLVLAGRGALERQVREATRDPRIRYLGQIGSRERRADFWRAVDVFCLPSSAEGLSISLLEAMASGCAVAATAAGGAAAVGGVAAELDPARLPASIAARLTAWRDQPEERRRQGDLAREEAVRHHGMAAMLDRLLAIYASARADL